MFRISLPVHSPKIVYLVLSSGSALLAAWQAFVRIVRMRSARWVQRWASVVGIVPVWHEAQEDLQSIPPVTQWPPDLLVDRFVRWRQELSMLGKHISHTSLPLNDPPVYRFYFRGDPTAGIRYPKNPDRSTPAPAETLVNFERSCVSGSNS